MNAAKKTEARSWTLDLHVPVAVLVTILVQTAGVVWWGARLDTNVTGQEARIIRLEKAYQDQRTIDERTIRLEEQQKSAEKAYNRLEDALREVNKKLDVLTRG
jgi:predicted Holliday junction resolvase-like endonuclease